MTADQYLSEIEQRLRKHFSASRDGYKLPDQDRHRLEGFMQGAVFMGFATSQQLADLMERVHFSVFGKPSPSGERKALASGRKRPSTTTTTTSRLTNARALERPCANLSCTLKSQ